LTRLNLSRQQKNLMQGETPMAAQNGIGGYVGKILRVDLTSERISEEILDSETLRKYVGGTALGAKYLYEEVPPGVEWWNPENRIMFFTGPLSGTVAGSGIFSVISKGATTNLAGTSQANGFFGAFLKFAGFDGIIVQGQAKKWSYLYVHDNIAEIRSAEDLVGKDTWETEDAIKKGLKRQSSAYAIGPAGENLVRFACIVGDHGHVVAHSGLGAVMGSKKLKAVVAERGQQKIPVVDPERLKDLAKSMYETAMKAMPTLSSGGTASGYPILYRGGQLPVKNYTTNIFPEYEKFGPDWLRTHFNVTPTSCWGCRIAHCRMTEVTEGPYKGYVGEEPEYEALAGMSAAIGNADPGATVMLGNEIDRLGLEVNESSYTIAWMMECYEKGLLSKDDLDKDMPIIDKAVGYVDAVDPDLSKFKASGGKLLLSQGWADTGITPETTIWYYESVLDKMGRKQNDWMRLFMAPGMGHCGGGPGVNTFDSIGALEKWVEKGVAPDQMIGMGAKGLTRPLCPYPQYADYKGTGDLKNAENWACKAPAPETKAK
jgi:aldehyde:ferredoxin oxidoreductase